MINNEFNPWVRRVPIIAMSVVVLYSLLAHASFYHYQLWNCPNRKHLILVFLVVLNWILLVYLRINYDIVIGWLKALEDRFPVEE